MKTKTPKSSEDVLSQSRETVSMIPNKGNVIAAQPTVDGGLEAGVGRWRGDAEDIAFEKA